MRMCGVFIILEILHSQNFLRKNSNKSTVRLRWFGSELTAWRLLLTYYASPLCMLLSATLGEVLT